jgi:hypothetical protein
VNRALRILAAGLLVGLVPVSVSGCGMTCACGLPPLPNGWAYPDQVTSLVAPVMGSDGQPTTLTVLQRGDSHFNNEVRGGSWIALVDCNEVFEAVFETRMPDTDSLTVNSAGALAAAASYVEAAGYVAGGDLAHYRESTHEVHQAGVALIDVTFSPPDSTPPPDTMTGTWPDLEVLVNGSSGQVFALVDHARAWCGRGVAAPVVGKGRAAALAQAAASGPGLAVVSAELQLDLRGGPQRAYWEIGLGSAGSSASAATAPTVTVQVDANTGEAQVQLVTPPPSSLP